MAATEMTEEKKVHLVRNALLMAGAEMGKDGDHWPVIKSTVVSIMKDWEELQIERNVGAELNQHYGDIISTLEKNLDICPPDMRPEAELMIKDLREMHKACFEPIDETMFVVCDADIPIYIKRAEKIIRTLGEDND